MFNFKRFYLKATDLILNNINLVIHPNKITAIVGRSGAGKSTLIDLLPRIISPNSGNIYIDGNNIRDYSLASLRDKMSFFSQDTILFDGTISDNICYYLPDSNKSEIIKASTLVTRILALFVVNQIIKYLLKIISNRYV